MHPMNALVMGVFVFVSMIPVWAFAQDGGGSCATYPYSEGMTVVPVGDSVKILATSSASVSFDDMDSIKDARTDATIDAKAQIAKYFEEIVSSDEAINKSVRETKAMAGDQKQVSRKDVIDRVKKVRNSAKALLRGVVVLGDCYTKGREVRVSVGLKPETIAGAGKLAGAIGSSLAENPTPKASAPAVQSGQKSGGAGSRQPNSGGQTPTPSTPLQGMDSSSNTKRLDNF